MMLNYSKQQFVMIAILSLLSYGLYGQTTYYVSTLGNNNNNSGESTDQAWRTIQYAVDNASAGDEIQVLAGTYNELIEFNKSGSSNQNIVLKNYGNARPIIDGTGLQSSSGYEIGIIKIEDQNFIEISGFELRNLITSNSSKFPAGIWVLGDAHDININNNKIHSIEQNGANAGAHGLAVYGRKSPGAIYNISITENEIYNCVLGWSESLVLNGNVKDFEVNYNTVHDNNNIGIDFIGHEGECPNPALDQARDGVCKGNKVYNIDSRGNPAYGNDASADGIYVDGGKNIIIEQNEVYRANIGIEVASEWSGKVTSEITVRNNFVYNCHAIGFSMGGYDSGRGETRNCTVINNTFFGNDTDNLGWGAEILIQYYCYDNIIKNNIFYAGNNGVLMANWNNTSNNNDLNHNLYYTTGSPKFSYNSNYYTSFSAYQSGTGQGSNSSYENPQLISTSTPNLHISSSSPTINSGINLSNMGTSDFDGQNRIQGGTVDIGADEFANGPSCTTGQACDDEDACTTGTTYDANCNCTGGTYTCGGNDCELLANSNFDNNLQPDWENWECTATSVNGVATITNIANHPDPWLAGFKMENIVLEQGKSYSFKFRASADANRSMLVKVGKNTDPWPDYIFETIELTTNMQNFTMDFTMPQSTSNDNSVNFFVGGNQTNVYIDNASLQKADCETDCPTAGATCDDENPSTTNDQEDGFCNCIGTPCPTAGVTCDDENPSTTNDQEDGFCNCSGTPINPPSSDCELLANSDFDNNLQPDWENWECTATSVNGVATITNIANHPDPWLAGFKMENIVLEQGKSYTFKFRASADANRSMLVKVGKNTDPWPDYIFETIELTTNMQNFTMDFTMPQSTSNDNSVNFFVGGSQTNVYIDNASLQKADCETDCPTAGATCDDENPSTTNDQEDGFCNCIGTPCPTAGATCDDENPSTTNDQEDGFCNCSGTLCPPAGATCDDENPSTTNDQEDGFCNCSGTPINPPSSDCELLANSDFDNNLQPDWENWECTATSVNGVATITNIANHPDPWLAGFKMENIVLEQGKSYSFKFRASADANRSMLVKVGKNTDPWPDYIFETIELTTNMQNFTMNFTMPQSTSNDNSVNFFVGGSQTNVYIDNASLQKADCASSSCTQEGETCNDENPCTIGSTYNADCDCVGGTYTDADEDGWCIGEDPDDNDVCNPNTCNDCNVFNTTNFDSNWGIWNDGGGDNFRSRNYPNSGTLSVAIRDNSGAASSTYTDVLDLSAVSSVNISFTYVANSMENNEDFFFEISTDGGNSYTIIEDWKSNDEFVNGTRYDETVTMTMSDENFTSNTVFRFRCDASGNGDQVYIDDIVIEACGGSISSAKEEVSTLLSVNLYPNPAKNILNIDFENVIDSEGTAQIFTASGQLVNQQNIPSGVHLMNIPIDQISAGIYIIRLQFDNGLYSTQRFVKLAN